jgi:hypothetical protein
MASPSGAWSVPLKHGREKHEVEVREGMTMGELRRAVYDKTRVPPARQRLMARRKLLRGDDDTTVEEAGLERNARLMLVGNAVQPLQSAGELDGFRLGEGLAADEVQVRLLRAGEVAERVAAFVDQLERGGAASSGLPPEKLRHVLAANSEIFTRVVLSMDSVTRDSVPPDTYQGKRDLTKRLLALCDRLDALRSRL